MGHRSTIIFASILAMATACSQDFDANEIATTDNVDDAEPGYAVPVEQALRYLDNELDMIYGDQTRAAMPRRTVKAVRNVEYRQVAQTTRAAEMPEDVADLFYIVEFADGEGSAVLGADARVEPVLAILDQTVLTPEDFEKADIESDDITSYMTAMIAKSATNQLASFPGITIDTTRLPIDKFWGPGRDTVYCKQAPLLKTKWHQGSPYNDMYPPINSTRYPAGCGVIAVAQILAYNKYPEIVSIGETYIDWTIVNKFKYGYYGQTNTDKAHIATVIINIGKLMNMRHTHDENKLATLTSTSDAVSTMQCFGYKQVSSREYSFYATRNMICDKHLPVFMRGEEYGRTNSGHAWIIDGWNEYTVRYWNCYYDTHGGTDMEILDKVLLESRTYTKMHCNLGWGGICDGYYSENMFDTTKRLDANNVDTSIGDYAGIGGYTFNSNFKIITYTL